MISSSLEEYLIAIYKLQNEQPEIKCSDVAKVLDMPLKKAVQAIQRLHYQKYVVYLPYQPLTITEKGKDMAKYLAARNELLEEFFEILQFPQSQQAEKEAMRQYLSFESLEAIEKFVMFVRQYPEITTRYKIFNKKKVKMRLLEPIPEGEEV
jgi:Mn-dependent DtxR family transcriptional regulator